MAYNGYHFYVGDLELPYAPSELKLTIGSNNTTVELIDGNEINILKSPKLTEIEFEVELPRGRQYAFANDLVSAKKYTDYFEKLMVKKQPTQLVVTRPRSNLGMVKKGEKSSKNSFESTVLDVSLEGYTLEESAENAYDIKVSLRFKEYLSYGAVTTNTVNNNNGNGNGNGNGNSPTNKPPTEAKKYTIKSGDTLWGIARKFYGDGSKWQKIYNANKTVIENTAKKYGRKSSSNGHWIYPGTVLTIPSN